TVDGAEAMLADLRAAGFDGAMTGGDAYRVWTGLFSDRERGRALAEAIAGAGFENFIAEHTVGGSGVLPGGDGEAHAALRTHLEALPDRTRRLALAVESGSGAAGLAAELRDAERELERLEPPPASRRSTSRSCACTPRFAACWNRPVRAWAPMPTRRCWPAPRRRPPKLRRFWPGCPGNRCRHNELLPGRDSASVRC